MAITCFRMDELCHKRHPDKSDWFANLQLKASIVFCKQGKKLNNAIGLYNNSVFLAIV